MKRLRLVLLLVLMFSLVTTTVAGDSFLLTSEKQIRLWINGESTDMTGYIGKQNGLAYVPLRGVSNYLQGYVEWVPERQAVFIHRPNAHIILAEQISRDFTLSKPFMAVDFGKSYSFGVMVQVDNMRARHSVFQVEIVDPDNQKLLILESERRDPGSFIMVGDVQRYSFNKIGVYEIRVSMRLTNNANQDAVTIATKTIEVRQ